MRDPTGAGRPTRDYLGGRGTKEPCKEALGEVFRISYGWLGKLLGPGFTSLCKGTVILCYEHHYDSARLTLEAVAITFRANLTF